MVLRQFVLLPTGRHHPVTDIQAKGHKLLAARALHLHKQPIKSRLRGVKPEMQIRAAPIAVRKRVRGLRINVKRARVSFASIRPVFAERLLRHSRFGEFLKARIVPERIKHWIEAEKRGSERRLPAPERTFIGKGEHFLQGRDRALGLAHLCRHPGENFDRSGAVESVFRDRHRGHRPFLKD